jgi:ferredoxin-type protein NapH
MGSQEEYSQVTGMAYEQLRFIGFLYALVFFFVLFALWYTKRWKRWQGISLLVITIALGFLIFSPIIPWQFQQLVLRDVQGIGGPIGIAVIGLIIMLALSFLFGRFYCGYLCPVGAVQELGYLVPVPKLRLRSKILPYLFRWAFFLVFIGAGIALSLSILALFGIGDFFHLVLTTGFFVFLVLIGLSFFLYRPFCRFFCPFGAIVSLPAMGSRFKIQRTDACIECKKCENACPTNEAKKTDLKAECYLCHRCLDVCPVEGALEYTRVGRKTAGPEKPE